MDQDGNDEVAGRDPAPPPVGGDGARPDGRARTPTGGAALAANRVMAELAAANARQAQAVAEVAREFSALVRGHIEGRMRAVFRDEAIRHEPDVDRIEAATWPRLGSLRRWDPRNPWAYVRQAAQYAFEDWIRRKLPLVYGPGDGAAAPDDDPALHVEQLERAEALKAIIRRLPAEAREIVLLHQGLGLEYAAIYYVRRNGTTLAQLTETYLARGTAAMDALNDLGRALSETDDLRLFVRRARETFRRFYGELAAQVRAELG